MQRPEDEQRVLMRVQLTPFGRSYFTRLNAGEQLEALGAVSLGDSEFDSVTDLCTMALWAGRSVAVAFLTHDDAEDVFAGRKRLVAVDV